MRLFRLATVQLKWNSLLIDFSALTLLVGIPHQEEHPAVKNWVIRCWHYHRSGARCRWFACSRVDATATPLLWPPYGIGQAIVFLSRGFFLLSLLSCYLFSSPNLSGRRLDVYHTPDVALVRIQNACLKCAAHGSLEMQDPKKSPKICHLGTVVQLCQAISSQVRHISTVGKKLLSSNISFIRPHNMVNFGQLAAEICRRLWGTPANFNEFCISVVLLHGCGVVWW